MRYFATIKGQERTIDLEPLDGVRFRVRIGESEEIVVDARWVERETLNLLVGSQSHDAVFESHEDGLLIHVGDESHVLELIDERKRRMLSAVSHRLVDGPIVVRSPMPGKLVKLLVAIGDEVVEGQGVAIVEAMKMENELRSPKAGRVQAVHAGEGDAVEGRQALVEVV